MALLIMAHHFMNDEEPLAMVVSPIIFNGLLSLLRRTNPNGGEGILSVSMLSSRAISAIYLIISLDNESMRGSAKPHRWPSISLFRGPPRKNQRRMHGHFGGSMIMQLYLK